MIVINGITLLEIIELCRHIDNRTTDLNAFVRFTKAQYGEDATFENFVDHGFEYYNNFDPKSHAAFAVLFGVYLRNEAEKYNLSFYKDGTEHIFPEKIDIFFEKKRREFIKRGKNYFSEYVMEIIRWYREAEELELKKRILYEVTKYYQVFVRLGNYRMHGYEGPVKAYTREQLLENDLWE